MEQKPKNTKGSKGFRGKGFYIAMYASLGGLLVLAVAIGYYNFLAPDSYEQDAIGVFAEATIPFDDTQDALPVSGDLPHFVQTTPPPTPMPTAPPGQNQQSDAELSAPELQPIEVYIPGDAGHELEYELDILEAEQEQDEYHAEADDEMPNLPETAEAEEQTPDFEHFTADGTMHWPVLGEVLMEFALDRLVYDVTLDQWRTNDNIAIGASRGDNVRAAAEGVVIDIVYGREFGHAVVIDHGNGWVTTYSQLEEELAVDVGDVVTRGQILGQVGSPSIFSSLMGYHLSFSVQNEDGLVDPSDILDGQ